MTRVFLTSTLNSDLTKLEANRHVEPAISLLILIFADIRETTDPSFARILQ